MIVLVVILCFIVVLPFTLASMGIRMVKDDHFVKEYYPDVDPDHLLLPAFGLSSVTNMDLLESSLKYDIENQVLDRYPDPLHALGMMIDIKRKIDAYKTRPVL